MKIGNYIITPSWGDVPIWKNKSFEWQFEKASFVGNAPLEIKLRRTRNRDHAGISFTFGHRYLFWMNLNIYDHRHWDHQNNTWCIK